MARLTATWRHADRPAGQPSLDVALSPGGTVVDEVRTLTPAEIETATARLAGALRSQGVRRGDTVAWQAANRWEVVALYRACWRLGAVTAPLHHQAGQAEVDRMVRRLDPALVVDPDRVEVMIDGGDPLPAPGGGADGEHPVAVVEARTATSGDELAADLMAWCREHLDPYTCPVRFDLVDTLPRDPNGKVLKRVLREAAWADSGRRI